MSTTTKGITLTDIEYWVEWLSRQFAAGKWRSYFTGRGFDFQGIVPYRDDPDLVRINWQASINTGELHVNTFSEERNIMIFFLGNLSPAMAFGSERTKIERLALIAALLSFSTFRKKDYFRFVGYTNEVELGFPQPRDKDYPLLLAEAILNFDWESKSRGGLLEAAQRVPSQKSLVILVSDLMGDLTGVPETLELLAPKHDVLPIILWDKMEVELPHGIGFIPMRDLETGRQTHVLLCKRTREALRHNIEIRRSEIQAIFRRFGIEPFFLTEISESDLQALITIFLERRVRF